MKKLSLLRHFTIFSAIAFIITGTTLGFFISDHIKKDKIKTTREIINLTLNVFMKTELLPYEFDKAFTKEKNNLLDIKYQKVIEYSNTSEIKIWDKNGDILYSNDSSLVGKHYTLNQNLERAINNNSIITVSKYVNGDNSNFFKKSEKIIKVYEPIVFDNLVYGVFEVSKPYSEVSQHMAMINRTITIIMFFGLLILYLFLLKIISNSSKTLILQNNSLTIQTLKLEESYIKLNSNYKNTVNTLSKAVDARDPYTAGHSERVSKISLTIGKSLGLSKNQLETLELAALFHDVGKLGVPDKVLHKPDKLTKEEFEKIKAHPEIGVDILKNVDFLKPILSIILYHHERFSGGGYPTGIKGTDIPREARIIALADTYDAMTSDRPYRKLLSHETAVDEIVKFKEVQFDPDIVEAFLKVENQIIDKTN